MLSKTFLSRIQQSAQRYEGVKSKINSSRGRIKIGKNKNMLGDFYRQINVQMPVTGVLLVPRLKQQH